MDLVEDFCDNRGWPHGHEVVGVNYSRTARVTICTWTMMALGDHDKHTETIVGTGAVIAYL